jgi:hypothetical protein
MAGAWAAFLTNIMRAVRRGWQTDSFPLTLPGAKVDRRSPDSRGQRNRCPNGRNVTLQKVICKLLIPFAGAK